MKSYCLKCKKDAENINPNVSGTSNGKATMLSRFATCGSKKSRFIKNQKAKGLLSNLGLRTELSKVTILGDILFWMQFHWMQLRWENKMNKIVNKFLLAGDKFMPEIHLKQPRFTYSACGPFTKKQRKHSKI